ncbi:EAL domain-containing protein [Alteromonadaceae bacterium BrNp21-10]|nr:EAL domain-containing protein [Alteromonadaceae bacterium BrNp21-10]
MNEKQLNTKQWIKYLVVLLSFWLSLNCIGETLHIDESLSEVTLSKSIKVIRTQSSQQLSFIQTLENWQPHADITPLESGDSLWGQQSIRNISNSNLSIQLVMANPALDHIDWYVMDSRNRIRQSTFMGTRSESPTYRASSSVFNLPLTIQANETLDVYFKLVDDGPMIVPISLVSEKQWQQNLHQEFLASGLVIGILGIFTLYFLATYTLLRSPIRFWFSIAMLAGLMLFINTQGVFTQWATLGAHITSLSTAFFALSLMCLSKVCYYILHPLPRYWRYTIYALSAITFASSLVFNAYWQLIISSALATCVFITIIYLTIRYSSTHSNLPNQLFALGIICLGTANVIYVTLLMNGLYLGRVLNLLLIGLSLFGSVFIALSIAIFNQVVQLAKNHQQHLAISELSQFYELFNNAAEGLYTSTLNGELIKVNPALCQLFGYESEEQMLSEVKNAEQLYSNSEDRLKLIKELHQNGMTLGRETKGLKRDGVEFWFSNSVQLKMQHGQEILFGSVFDITERKRGNLSLDYLVRHDQLTGLYNRREFERRLELAVSYAHQLDGQFALLLVNIDNFRLVNDACGHEAGNILIQQFCERIQAAISSRIILARLQGDEFGLLLEGELSDQAQPTAKTLLEVADAFRFVWDNRIFTVSLSIGIADNSEPDLQSHQQMLSMADAACCSAKAQGGNQFHLYTKEDKQLRRYYSEQTWITMLNQALDDDSFQLFYQPYHSLKTNEEGYRYELLLRLRHDIDNNTILPSSFIPTAERQNLMGKVDEWVISHYFKWLHEHPDHQQQLICCNINLSAHALSDPQLKQNILQAFKQYDIPHNKICFEINESVAIVKTEETLQFIKTFQKLGCLFALDDFGSGFASYSYLKKLPVDMIKIDGNFIKNLLIDSSDSLMVRSMNDVAKSLGVKTMAEFVESKEIMVELGKIGVDYAQGFSIAKPRALSEFTTDTISDK